MTYDSFFNKQHFDLKDKTILITGANSGLGFELMLHLLRFDARIVMACRSLKRAIEAKDRALSIFKNAKIEMIEYDQASFASIDEASKVIKNYDLFALVANAGIYYPKKDYKTQDDLELTIGTNYIGLDRLLYNLKDDLKRQNTRVILVTSLVARFSKMHEFEMIESLSRNRRYALSKLYINGLYHELIEEGLDCRLCHPGVCSTNIISNKDSGLPHIISRLGHRFLTIFTHKASKAALSEFLAVIINDYDQTQMIVPRGLFAISGYPCLKKIPLKYCRTDLHRKLQEYLKEKEKSNVRSQ